jgi:hypothetical protein
VLETPLGALYGRRDVERLAAEREATPLGTCGGLGLSNTASGWGTREALNLAGGVRKGFVGTGRRGPGPRVGP